MSNLRFRNTLQVFHPHHSSFDVRPSHNTLRGITSLKLSYPG